MKYKIPVSNNDMRKYLYSKIVDDFQKWTILEGLERPRLPDGQLGWYIEDVEAYWGEE